MKNGVPYFTAMEQLGDAEVIAYGVHFSEMDSGREYDWDLMEFMPGQT